MDDPKPKKPQTPADRRKFVAKCAVLPVAFVTTAAISAYLGWEAHDKAFRPVFDMMSRHTDQHMEFADKAEAFIDTKGLYSEFRKYLDHPTG